MNSWHTFYRTCIVLLTLLGAYLLWELSEIVVVLFAAIIFASTIRPLVGFLVRHRVPQSVAVMLIYLLTFGSLLALIAVSVPPLARFVIDAVSGGILMDQVRTMLAPLPLFLYSNFGLILPVAEMPEQLGELMTEVNDAGRDQALPVALTTLTGIGQFGLALVISYYWLTTRQSLLTLLLRLSPVHHRARTQTIWDDIEQTLGAYVRGQFILVILIGIASFAGLLLIRVPYALALAVVAGLTEVIPVVGPILGAVPAVLIAFAESPTKGLLVIGWYILIQQLEANVLVPKVMESNVGLNPLVVIVAIVAGGTLNGVLGALLAIPIAGALQVIAQHLLIEPTLTKRRWRSMDGGVLLEEEEEEEEEEGPAVPPTPMAPPAPEVIS